MIVRPDEWWRGDRLKAKIFADIRQLILGAAAQAYEIAPRRKSDITSDIAEAVAGAAAVTMGWRDDPSDWKAAADKLRQLADEMERSGLRAAPWGPNPTFDPTPVTFTAVWREDDGFVLLTFPDLPELDVVAGPDDDLSARVQTALDNAVIKRLAAGEELPRPRGATEGEVDVTLSPEVGGKALRFWAYGERPIAT
jgi:hypothetical protein